MPALNVWMVNKSSYKPKLIKKFKQNLKKDENFKWLSARPWISGRHFAYYYPSQNNGLEKFMYPTGKKVLKFKK